MKIKQICSLCCLSSSEYKVIQDEEGNSNEFYDIAVKYFDPMILTEAHSFTASSLRIICCSCWSHIDDFHEFQQRVLNSRTLLLDTIENKVDVRLIKALKGLQVDNKDWLSDDNLTAGEPTDLDDEVPLVTLLKESRSRRRTGSKDKSATSVDTEYHGSNPLDCIVEMQNHTVSIRHRLLRPKEMFNTDDLRRSSDISTNDHDEANVKLEHDLEDTCDFIATGVNTKETHTDQTQLTTTLCGDIGTKTKPSARGRKSKQTSISRFSNVLRHARNRNGHEVKSIIKLKDKSLENDTFIAKWKPILDCDLCSATVSNFEEMRDHFRAEHNTRCYIKCCERKFYRRYVLTEHIRLHVNPETHKCDICGKRSTTKYNLKLHKQVVHSESKQFECDVCKRLFNQKPTLDRHLLTHMKGDKKFFCKECERGYYTEDQLKYHVKTVHNVDRVCDQCGKTIHGIAALKKHLMEHSGIERRKYPCDICGAELVTNYGLRRHKAAYHHDGSTAYVCSICGKIAASQNALVSHKKNVHENGRRYNCTYCEKAFKRAKVLREHIATHTGVDLYQCPHCPQTFKVSANMHHHRKRAHPTEWEEGRKNRTSLPKVNIELVTNQVVL